VGHEAGEDLVHPGEDPSLVSGQLTPGLDPGGPGRQLSGGWHHPQLPLAAEGPLPDHLPSVVEPPPVPVGPGGRHVVRGVHRARREVEEERLVRGGVVLVTKHADGGVGQVLGEVVPVLRGTGRLGDVVVPGQQRRPVVGVAVEEPVEALEPQPQGPEVERARRAALVTGGQVPLPDRVGAVARVAQ
jgi:hypothetical protein